MPVGRGEIEPLRPCVSFASSSTRIAARSSCNMRETKKVIRFIGNNNVESKKHTGDLLEESEAT